MTIRQGMVYSVKDIVYDTKFGFQRGNEFAGKAPKGQALPFVASSWTITVDVNFVYTVCDTDFMARRLQTGREQRNFTGIVVVIPLQRTETTTGSSYVLSNPSKSNAVLSGSVILHPITECSILCAHGEL